MEGHTDESRDSYRRIGVRPFINCCGTRTIHGGTLMLPEVRQAMAEASNAFVNLDELTEGVGRRLAELTGAGWGIVTSGAAGALCHATASAVAGADPEKMLRLPDTTGLNDRVVMLKRGRFTYDHAIRMVGVTVVEVETLDDLRRALDNRVAVVALLGMGETAGPFHLEDIAGLARPLGIPVLVDAAAEPLERPNPYLTRGATMVAYSGGKYLRGPQCTGLLLGEEPWVRAAWVNSAPHHTLGRALKVGKEEIMGLLAAVEHWAKGRDPSAEGRQWEADLRAIADEVAGVPSVRADVRRSEGPGQTVPRLEICWDEDCIALTGLDLRARLLESEPRIMLDDRRATGTSILILPFSLQPGEAQVVGARIREALADVPCPEADAAPPPAPVAGSWDVEITFIRGTSRHGLELEQTEHDLSGVHRTLYHRNSLTGRIHGTDIEVSSLHPFEGTHLAYRFLGTVDGDVMEGAVELGSSGQAAIGPVNQREYGSARWRATRKASSR